MSQRLSEGIQHKLLLKLLELNYTIEYKKGAKNKVADALSRVEHELSSITSATPAWISDIEESYSNDKQYTIIIQHLLVNAQAVSNYSVHSEILRYKGKICIGDSAELKNKILSSLHSSAIGGHSDIKATYHRVKRNFHWPHLKKTVETFLSQCVVCQRAKLENCQYPDLLAPLPIPNMAWTFIIHIY
jgi:hypothetical protein